MPAVDLAVIAAAGLGSRLGAAAPKCLVKIDGRTLIERQLELLVDVPEVRVIVGFREHDVMEHVSSIRPDVVFVRNPDFARTHTIHSLRRAVQHSSRWFLAIDGDLVIEPTSFRAFLDTCAASDAVLAVGPSGTEDGVYVQTASVGSTLVVTSFSRERHSDYEWSGMAHLHSAHIADGERYVFETLVDELPMRAAVIDAAEVDTPQDLQRARNLVRSWDRSPNGSPTTAPAPPAVEVDAGGVRR